jgi:YbbR domain-containing protein
MYPVSLSPRGLRGILRDTNLQAEFTIEALKSREVPVIVSTSGKLIDPTEIVDNMKPDPKKATIDGPADNVARVVSARATLRLDMLDPHAGQQQVNLDPVDKDDRVVENVDIHPSQVIVTPQFSLAPQHKQVFVEALFTDAQVPEGYAVKSYSIDPSRVTASGSGQALLHIAKVSTEKIDLSKMTTTQTLTVPLKTVSNDITITPSTVQITIIIEPIALKGLSPKSSPTGSSTSKPGGTSPGL